MKENDVSALATVFLAGVVRWYDETLAGRGENPSFDHPAEVSKLIDDADTFALKAALRLAFIDGMRHADSGKITPRRVDVERHYRGLVPTTL